MPRAADETRTPDAPDVPAVPAGSPSAAHAASPRRAAPDVLAGSPSAAQAGPSPAAAVPSATSPRQHEILQNAVEEAARLLHTDGAIVYLVDDDGASMVLANVGGIDDRVRRDRLAGLQMRTQHGLFGLAVRTRDAQVTGDYLTDPRFQHNDGADAAAASIGLRSMAVAPLISDTVAIGALGTYTATSDRFTEADLALIRALADHAAAAIANDRLIAELASSRVELARRAATEQSLREIAAGITAIRDPAELLQHTVEEAARLLRADGAIIDLIDPATGRLRWAFDTGMHDTPERARFRQIELEVGDGVFGRAVAELRVVNTGDYHRDPGITRPPSPSAFATGFQIQSSMAAPMIGETGPVGAIGVWARRSNAWDASDEATIRALADVASVAMTSARLIEQLGHSERELAHRVETERALRSIASRIAELTDLEDVLQRLVDDARRLLGSDDAHLTLMDESGQFLVPVVVAGATEPDVRAWLTGQQFPLNGGINGLAAARAEPVWTADYMVDPRVPHEDDDQVTAERLGLRAVAVVPLRGAEGAILGTLAVSFRTPREVAPEQIDLLQALGDQAAIAIANSNLYERLRASEARFRYLVESSPDIVFRTDATGTFTYVSDTILPATGWRPDELVGSHFSTIIAPENLPFLVERWEETRRNPATTQHYRFTMLHRDGRRIPGEIHGRGIEEEGVFAGAHGSVRDVADQIRLERDLREQAAELAASQERGHLARELHDSVTQALFSMTLLTRSIELLLQRDPEAAAEKLADLRELQRDALAEMRSLIFELRPGSLADDGLVKALRTHTAAVQGRIGLPIVFTADELERLPIEIEDGIYRIAQEALHNVVKHAAARQVRLTLAREPDAVRLIVADDGMGFDPAETPPGHLGIAGMRARAEKIGADLALTSQRGVGTTIDVRVPVATQGPDEAMVRTAPDAPVTEATTATSPPQAEPAPEVMAQQMS